MAQNSFNVQRSQALRNFQDIQDALTSISNEVDGSDPATSLGIKQETNGVTDRQPWLMSTTEWLTQNPAQAIVWAANPDAIAWTMAQRGSVSKNLYGTVHHYWPDNFRDTYFDEPRISLTFQSGCLLPVVLQNDDGDGQWVASAGLMNFYDFLNLMDAPKLTKDGRVNLVSIKYNSNLFPDMTIFGLFDPSGVRFTDSSRSPNAVESWSAEFIVHDTFPRLSTNGRSQTEGQVGNLINRALLNQYGQSLDTIQFSKATANRAATANPAPPTGANYVNEQQEASRLKQREYQDTLKQENLQGLNSIRDDNAKQRIQQATQATTTSTNDLRQATDAATPSVGSLFGTSGIA